MPKINVLSLFNGLGTIAFAFDDLGIEYNLFVSEIDAHANKAFHYFYPNVTNLGSVENIITSDVRLEKLEGKQIWIGDLPKIDLLVGGSPCQGFSNAGKGLNFDDPRSKLFFNFVDIKNAILKRNPKMYFMLENVVPQKKEWQNIITEYIGIEPIFIDSNLVSAQNRKRLYWTNIKAGKTDLFGTLRSGIPQPKDRNIFLRDIIEKNPDSKLFLSAEKVAKIAAWQSTQNPLSVLLSNSSSFAGTITAKDGTEHSGMKLLKVDREGNPKTCQTKASTIKVGGNSGGNHSDMDLLLGFHPILGRFEKAKADRKENLRNGKDYNSFQDKEIVRLETEKMSTVTSTYSNYNLLGTVSLKGRKKDGAEKYTTEVTIQDGRKSCTVKQNTERTDLLLLKCKDITLRKLSPLEVTRLFTMSDKWCNELMDWKDEKSKRMIPNTAIYKMLGNGWTLEVIKHILSFM